MTLGETGGSSKVQTSCDLLHNLVGGLPPSCRDPRHSERARVCKELLGSPSCSTRRHRRQDSGLLPLPRPAWGTQVLIQVCSPAQPSSCKELTHPASKSPPDYLRVILSPSSRFVGKPS